MEESELNKNERWSGRGRLKFSGWETVRVNTYFWRRVRGGMIRNLIRRVLWVFLRWISGWIKRFRRRSARLLSWMNFWNEYVKVLRTKIPAKSKGWHQGLSGANWTEGLKGAYRDTPWCVFWQVSKYRTTYLRTLPGLPLFTSQVPRISNANAQLPMCRVVER